MKFCDKCKREVVWGQAETSGERIAFDAWPERRYIFVYNNQPTVRWINTWSPHDCIQVVRSDRDDRYRKALEAALRVTDRGVITEQVLDELDTLITKALKGIA